MDCSTVAAGIGSSAGVRVDVNNPPYSADGESDIVSVLHHMRRLIDTAMSSYGGDTVSSVPGRQAINAATSAILGGARQDIRCSVATVFFAEEVGRLLDGLAADGDREPVHLEVLCEPKVAASEAGAALVGRRTSEVRVGPKCTPDMLVVDGERAFVRMSNAERDALVIRSPELVSLLHAFYADAWSKAISFRVFQDFARVQNCNQTKRIISMLAQGYKDDVAARNLGMSVRTYRRYVADLMRDLDAQSRFQVGVRAAQLGLMGPC